MQVLQWIADREIQSIRFNNSVFLSIKAIWCHHRR